MFRQSVSIGVVGASRSCFLIESCRNRLVAVRDACRRLGINVGFTSSTDPRLVFEDVEGAEKAASWVIDVGYGAAVLYLGNFSPEKPDAVFVRMMNEKHIPVMVAAAAEESVEGIRVADDGTCNRGDALCGLLSCNYNLMMGKLVDYYIPSSPVGTPDEIARSIGHFAAVVATCNALRKAHIGIIGGRPDDFVTCETAEGPLRRLGVRVSLLKFPDMQEAVKKAAGDKEWVWRILAEMKQDLAEMKQEPVRAIGNGDDEFMMRLAAYELALRTLAKKHGFTAIAAECWPLFEGMFGHVPCYVNSRMDASGLPASCEGDGYGAWTQIACQAASDNCTTLLDINHSIPDGVVPPDSSNPIPKGDLLGLFHCGRTPLCKMAAGAALKHQLIMARLMEPGKKPDITRGTLEGRIAASDITLVRLHPNPADGMLQAYIAEGEFLDVDPQTFGGVGVARIQDFQRFYRWAMLANGFPHHGAVAFNHCGSVLFDAFRMLGIPAQRIHFPLGPGHLYPGQNPFTMLQA